MGVRMKYSPMQVSQNFQVGRRNSLPSHEIPIYMDSYWNYCTSAAKIRWAMVKITAPISPHFACKKGILSIFKCVPMYEIQLRSCFQTKRLSVGQSCKAMWPAWTCCKIYMGKSYWLLIILKWLDFINNGKSDQTLVVCVHYCSKTPLSVTQNAITPLLWSVSLVCVYNLFISVHSQFNHYVDTITVGKIASTIYYVVPTVC